MSSPQLWNETLDLLKSQLSYDPDTGELRWRNAETVPMRRRGRQVHYTDIHGVYHFRHCGRQWAAHRIAWLIHYGDWPDFNISHVNRDNRDNRLVNLERMSMRKIRQRAAEDWDTDAQATPQPVDPPPPGW